MSLYLLDGFQWNFAQIFVVRMGIVEKVFKVRGQRSRSWPTQITSSGGGMHTFRRCGVVGHCLRHIRVIPWSRSVNRWKWRLVLSYWPTWLWNGLLLYRPVLNKGSHKAVYMMEVQKVIGPTYIWICCSSISQVSKSKTSYCQEWIEQKPTKQAYSHYSIHIFVRSWWRPANTNVIVQFSQTIIKKWPWPLTSDLENLFNNAHSNGEYLWQVSLKLSSK